MRLLLPDKNLSALKIFGLILRHGSIRDIISTILVNGKNQMDKMEQQMENKLDASKKISNLERKQSEMLLSQEQIIQVKIIEKLTETMCFRAAEGSKNYFRIMSARLSREKFEYVMQALTTLGERERGEGETALIDLASILREIRLLTPKPKTAYEQEVEEIQAEQRKAREQASGN